MSDSSKSPKASSRTRAAHAGVGHAVHGAAGHPHLLTHVRSPAALVDDDVDEPVEDLPELAAVPVLLQAEPVAGCTVMILTVTGSFETSC